MKIVVFGATGPSGRELVAEAARRGHEVTAFVRDEAKAAAAGFPVPVRLVTGDARNAAAVAAAIQGQDAVVSALGSGRSRSNPVCAEGIRNIVAGMKTHGVRRLVALSAYGTGDSRHGFYGWFLNTMAPAIQRDKEAMEAALAASGLDWTVVRPPVLNRGPATGRLKAGVGLVVPGFQAIPRADLAAWMLDELEARRFVGQMPVLGRAA